MSCPQTHVSGPSLWRLFPWILLRDHPEMNPSPRSSSGNTKQSLQVLSVVETISVERLISP